MEPLSVQLEKLVAHADEAIRSASAIFVSGATDQLLLLSPANLALLGGGGGSLGQSSHHLPFGNNCSTKQDFHTRNLSPYSSIYNCSSNSVVGGGGGGGVAADASRRSSGSTHNLFTTSATVVFADVGAALDGTTAAAAAATAVATTSGFGTGSSSNETVDPPLTARTTVMQPRPPPINTTSPSNRTNGESGGLLRPEATPTSAASHNNYNNNVASAAAADHSSTPMELFPVLPTNSFTLLTDATSALTSGGGYSLNVDNNNNNAQQQQQQQNPSILSLGTISVRPRAGSLRSRSSHHQLAEMSGLMSTSQVAALLTTSGEEGGDGDGGTYDASSPDSSVVKNATHLHPCNPLSSLDDEDDTLASPSVSNESPMMLTPMPPSLAPPPPVGTTSLSSPCRNPRSPQRHPTTRLSLSSLVSRVSPPGGGEDSIGVGPARSSSAVKEVVSTPSNKSGGNAPHHHPQPQQQVPFSGGGRGSVTHQIHVLQQQQQQQQQRFTETVMSVMTLLQKLVEEAQRIGLRIHEVKDLEEQQQQQQQKHEEAQQLRRATAGVDASIQTEYIIHHSSAFAASPDTTTYSQLQTRDVSPTHSGGSPQLVKLFSRSAFMNPNFVGVGGGGASTTTPTTTTAAGADPFCYGGGGGAAGTMFSTESAASYDRHFDSSSSPLMPPPPLAPLPPSAMHLIPHITDAAGWDNEPNSQSAMGQAPEDERMSFEDDDSESRKASYACGSLTSIQFTSQAQKAVDEFTGIKMLNNYVLMNTLGSGSCGKVKQAYSLERNIPVAIKSTRRSAARVAPSTVAESQMQALELQPDRLGRAPTGAEIREASLRREIAVMKKLNHKHIVKLYEVIDDPMADKLYLVMQFIDKGSIGALSGATMSTGDGSPGGGCGDLILVPHIPVTLDVVCDVGRQVCSALAFMHDRGMVHRDIKPENILISSEGRVYLTDFGISEIGESSRSNGPGGISSKHAGTRDFMSPEQWLSLHGLSPSVSHRTSKTPQVNTTMDNNDGGGCDDADANEEDGSERNTSIVSTVSSHRIGWLTGAVDVWAFGITMLSMFLGRVPSLFQQQPQQQPQAASPSYYSSPTTSTPTVPPLLGVDYCMLPTFPSSPLTTMQTTRATTTTTSTAIVSDAAETVHRGAERRLDEVFTEVLSKVKTTTGSFRGGGGVDTSTYTVEISVITDLLDVLRSMLAWNAANRPSAEELKIKFKRLKRKMDDDAAAQRRRVQAQLNAKPSSLLRSCAGGTVEEGTTHNNSGSGGSAIEVTPQELASALSIRIRPTGGGDTHYHHHHNNNNSSSSRAIATRHHHGNDSASAFANSTSSAAHLYQRQHRSNNYQHSNNNNNTSSLSSYASVPQHLLHSPPPPGPPSRNSSDAVRISQMALNNALDSYGAPSSVLPPPPPPLGGPHQGGGRHVRESSLSMDSIASMEPRRAAAFDWNSPSMGAIVDSSSVALPMPPPLRMGDFAPPS